VMLETEGKKEMSAEELLKKLGRVHRVDLQLTLRDLGPTSRIFSSSPCRIQFTVLYLHPLRGNTQNPAASLSTPKPLWRPKHLKSFRSPPPVRDPPITQILHAYWSVSP